MPHSRSISLCREATRSARGGERETNRGPGSRVCDGCPLGNGGYGHGCADRLARRAFAAGRRTATDPARGQDTGGSPRRPAFRRPGVRPVQGAQAPAPERACQAFLVYLTRKVLTTQQRHQAEERLRKRGRRPGNAVPGGAVLTSGDGTAALDPEPVPAEDQEQLNPHEGLFTLSAPGNCHLPRPERPPSRRRPRRALQDDGDVHRVPLPLPRSPSSALPSSVPSAAEPPPAMHRTARRWLTPFRRSTGSPPARYLLRGPATGLPPASGPA